MAEMTRAQVKNIVKLARQKREMPHLSGVDLTEAALGGTVFKE